MLKWLLCITGYLQVQFLSSAIGCRIQQHSQFKYDDLYQLIMEPCCEPNCKEGSSTVHIIWVQFSEESLAMNHICPLIPQEEMSESLPGKLIVDKQYDSDLHSPNIVIMMQQTSIYLLNQPRLSISVKHV